MVVMIYPGNLQEIFKERTSMLSFVFQESNSGSRWRLAWSGETSIVNKPFRKLQQNTNRNSCEHALGSGNEGSGIIAEFRTGSESHEYIHSSWEQIRKHEGGRAGRRMRGSSWKHQLLMNRRGRKREKKWLGLYKWNPECEVLASKNFFKLASEQQSQKLQRWNQEELCRNINSSIYCNILLKSGSSLLETVWNKWVDELRSKVMGKLEGTWQRTGSGEKDESWQWACDQGNGFVHC